MTDPISDESVFLAYQKVRDLPVWGESKPKEGTAVLAIVAIQNMNADIGCTLHFFTFEMKSGVSTASYSTDFFSSVPFEMRAIPKKYDTMSHEHDSLCSIIFGNEYRQPQDAKVLAWIPMEEVDGTLCDDTKFLDFLQKAYDVVGETASIWFNLYDYRRILLTCAKTWGTKKRLYAFPKIQKMLKDKFGEKLEVIQANSDELNEQIARLVQSNQVLLDVLRDFR